MTFVVDVQTRFVVVSVHVERRSGSARFSAVTALCVVLATIASRSVDVVCVIDGDATTSATTTVRRVAGAALDLDLSGFAAREVSGADENTSAAAATRIALLTATEVINVELVGLHEAADLKVVDEVSVRDPDRPDALPTTVWCAVQRIDAPYVRRIDAA